MLQQLTIIHPQPDLLTTHTDIANFEIKYRVKLPDYLKTFILSYGGQGVAEVYFLANDTESEKMDFIFPLNYRDGMETIEGLVQGLSDIKGEVKYIPFACASAITLFVKTVGADADDIYYYRNGHDDENLLLRYERFTFESLINSLSSIDPDDIV